MAIISVPGFKPPVEKLYALTNVAFEPAAFKAYCESFSQFDPTCSDDDLWQFKLAPDLSLEVSLWVEDTGEKTATGYPKLRQLAVSCASLSFICWDKWTIEDHPSMAEYQKEQELFDEAFADELRRATEILGASLMSGRNSDKGAHRYAIWRGQHGLLILQQSAHDLQFGYDINYWIQNWSRTEDPEPEGVFMDWLHKQTLVPPGFQLPDTWEICGPGFEKELERELSLNLLHPLRGAQVASVARRKGTDDVLFQLYHKHPYQLAEVHLTWSMEWRKDWPSFTLFKTWDEWRSNLE